MKLTVYGVQDISAEDLAEIGQMIEAGYNCGYGTPNGYDWEITEDD